MDRIGCIGLGIMGKPMALHLIRAGYQVVALNRSPGPQNELVSAGAISGNSPKHVAEQSDVVITMLPDSPDVEQVILGKDGVLEGLLPGGLIIDMSTV
ncbi:MAG: NAD(P)-binding domain-containing protein, partial [Desulfomonilaceae bacterium]